MTIMTRVAVVDMGDDPSKAVSQVFEQTCRGRELIKGSGEVYLKPNAVDFKPYSFTSPEVLKEVINYFFEEGASKVFLMENSTQGNMTRVVFEFAGYHEVCKKTGAKPIYLDEMPTERVRLRHFGEVEFPRAIVERFINNDDYTYVSVPKLKTHSMSTVTLGVKNQMAFPSHKDRGIHHNNNLHQYLADIYHLIKPDYTIIDGSFAVFNGHYPLRTYLNESIECLDVLIGGTDTLAVDVVGSRVLGYNLEEVKHLALVNDVGDLGAIEVIGSLERFVKKYSYNIVNNYPDDVNIIQGRELLCPEGCMLNVLMLLQLLYYDYNGKGGFSILMGKGFDERILAQIEGKVLIAGDCAINETRDYLERRLGKKNVYTSPTCNRLASTMTALCKLMGVSALSLVPSRARAIKALIQGKIHGSRALVPSLF